MAGFLVWQIAAATVAQRALDHSDEVMAQLQELQNLFIDQETGLRGYQLTGDAVDAGAVESGCGTDPGAISPRCAGMVAGDAAQSKAVDEPRKFCYNQWLGFANAVLHQDPAALNAAGMNQRGKAMMDGIRGATANMVRHEEDLRAVRSRHARWLQRRELVSLLVSAVVVGIFLALFTRHHVHAVSASYQRRIAEITERSAEVYESQAVVQDDAGVDWGCGNRLRPPRGGVVYE